MAGDYFLCSHCRTEQAVSKIAYKGLKACFCPNCHEICCDDYCLFFHNGRWYPPQSDMFLLEIDERVAPEQQDELYNQAHEDYQAALAQFHARYERTKKEYGIA